MTDITKIEENFKKELLLPKANENKKLRHQLIIELLAKTISRSELNLYRWEKQIEVFRNHPSYVQLAGFFHVEMAVLLKERVILDLNNFIGTDGVSISYLFKHIKRGMKSYLDYNKKSEIITQIAKDEIVIKDILNKNIDLITYRNQNIAHNGIQKLGKTYEEIQEKFTPEMAKKLIIEFKSILSYYIIFFNISIDYSVEYRLKSQGELGFETGIEDLVSVVEQAFKELSFSSTKIAKIAKEFNIFSK